MGILSSARHTSGIPTGLRCVGISFESSLVPGSGMRPSGTESRWLTVDVGQRGEAEMNLS